MCDHQIPFGHHVEDGEACAGLTLSGGSDRLEGAAAAPSKGTDSNTQHGAQDHPLPWYAA